MKFLREIEGKARRDRIRNTYIKGELMMGEIQNRTDRNRLRWFGHIKRMD
jgi:hypothetical protein